MLIEALNTTGSLTVTIMEMNSNFGQKTPMLWSLEHEPPSEMHFTNGI